jgi:O-succinylbenzoic acid--CoA ligase
VTSLRPLAIAAGPGAVAALPVLRRALDGELAVLPYAASSPAPTRPEGAVPDEGTALVVGTSGSTGTPKLAMLPAAALAASAAATHDRLGGPGAWLLAMPPHHIAGVQVLLRCVAAGTEPGFVDLSDGFTPDAFTAAATGLTGERRYTSLVPTQLVRILADEEATTALAAFDAVLVGGAASPPALLARAREAGVRAVTTYGMSETCGGCVYDGLPLAGVDVRLGPDGRVSLGGSVLFSGYRRRPDLTAAALRDGRLLTADRARWDGNRLVVLGRTDDVVVSGGINVDLAEVERQIRTWPELQDTDVAVVGVPDREWGTAVVAVAERDGWSTGAEERLREHLHARLPAYAAPRRLLGRTPLPRTSSGKIDRLRIAADLTSSEEQTRER